MNEHLIYTQSQKWKIFIEMAAVFAVFMMLNVFNFFSQMASSVLLVLVFLFGIRYGLLYGVTAVIAGISSTVGMEWLNGSDIVLLLYDGPLLKSVSLMVVIGVTSGLFRSSLNERYQDLLFEKNEIDSERNDILTTLTLFKTANEQLKRKVLESENNLATVYSMTKMLKKDQSERVLDEAVGIIRDHYGAEVFGLYHVDSSHRVLRLKIQMTSEGRSMSQSVFYENFPEMFQRVIQEKSIFFKELDGTDSDHPLISAPIIIDQEVRYVLLIQNVDFYRLSTDGVEILKWILLFISDPLAQTLKREKESITTVLVPGTGFYTPEYFREIVEIQKERKKQLSQSFALFSLTLSMKHRQREKIAFLDEFFKKELREIDVIGFDEGKGMFHFLLPGTDPVHARKIEDRIRTSLKSKVKSIE
ncbi:hypothetical protein HF072_09410 [Bacillus sp. RO3]|nr:hypothetical protein [Bacillus sp. RO3]